MNRFFAPLLGSMLLTSIVFSPPGMAGASSGVFVDLSDEQVEDIVRRSYQYVALYNVVNKSSMDPNNPARTGWNNCVADTELKDHTMKIIARPNNDTLYIGCAMDLRKDPVILDIPAFDSKYVSLMTFTYDHYINVPLPARPPEFRSDG